MNAQAAYDSFSFLPGNTLPSASEKEPVASNKDTRGYLIKQFNFDWLG